MPLFLVTLNDKYLLEEQNVGWSILEAESQEVAEREAWSRLEVLLETKLKDESTRMTVSSVREFKINEWYRPHLVCNRRHMGSDGKFPWP